VTPAVVWLKLQPTSLPKVFMSSVSMVIGLASIEVHFPDSGSLKTKRQFLKRIKDRVRNKFNVSIAEVDHNDLWQRTTLGVSVVANQRQFANQVLSGVVDLIGKENGVQLLDYSIELL
jgi:uncharacterized protein YlxP (DUF503 family)